MSVVPAHAEPLLGNDVTKIYNVTIRNKLTTQKPPLATETAIWLNIIEWAGGS